MDLDYGLLIQDAVRTKLPKMPEVDAMPSAAKANFQSYAGFLIKSEGGLASVTIRRNYAMGEFVQGGGVPGSAQAFSGNGVCRPGEPGAETDGGCGGEGWPIEAARHESGGAARFPEDKEWRRWRALI